jgi:hypothetical protein
VWSVPGGRLDHGETLANCAIREVYEETGIEAQVDVPVGLHYMQGWRRVNILYRLRAIGGSLAGKTRETDENQFFSLQAIPENAFFADRIHNAIASVRPMPQTTAISKQEMSRLKRKFAWRWFINFVSGRPEPRYPIFRVNAVAIIRSQKGGRILALPSGDGFGYTLPRRTIHGEISPWDQLGTALTAVCGPTPTLQWVGIWQNPARHTLEFVFAGSASEYEGIRAGQWLTRDSGFNDKDALYIEYMTGKADEQPVWEIVETEQMRGGDVLRLHGELNER